ncbi:MAG: site-specific integrase [Nitrospirota bacterium]|jgi:integrase
MSLYRRSDSRIWWVSFNVRGVRKRISTGATNRKKAKLVQAKILADVQEDRWFERERAKSITFRQMAEKYVSRYKRQRDEHTLKHLLPYFGDMTLSEITAEGVEDYILDRDESEKRPAPATIYQEYSLGRRMFNVARKRWKWTSANPFADVEFSELLEIRNRRDRWLKGDEEARLLARADSHDLKDVIVFALQTGCRRGEILSLDWRKNIDFKRSLVTVQASKRGMLKTIPMSDSLYRMLVRRSTVQHISGRVFAMTGHGLRHVFLKCVKKAGIEDFRFHDLRHTFATRLVQNGVDIYRVKELMGHMSVKTTERYAHHYPESLRSSVKVLDSCHDLVTVG